MDAIRLFFNVLFGLALLLVFAPAPADATASEVTKVMASLLPRSARWALVAVDLKSGSELLRAGNAIEERLVPGSLIKLLLTGALLDRAAQGADLEMPTLLRYEGAVNSDRLDGNLFLVGRGNSLLSLSDLQEMATEMSRRGIAKVAGDLVVDDSFFEPLIDPSELQGAANSSAGALGLDLHTVALVASPASPGEPPVVRVEPANRAVRLAVSARTNSGVPETIKIGKLDDTSYSVAGNIPVGTAPVRRRFPLKDPALFAGGALRTVLESKGISVTGVVKRGKTPTSAAPLAQIPSPDMAGLLREMNVNSLNVVAENLLLLLGADAASPPGTRPKGVGAVRGFAERLGLPGGDLVIADGAGLSEQNRMTVGFWATYLHLVAQKPWFPRFYETLPRPGVEGTARDIRYSSDRFRVKTGLLPDAFGLAGYGADASGRKIAFAFLVNHPGISGFDMKRAGAEVLKLLANEVSQ